MGKVELWEIVKSICDAVNCVCDHRTSYNGDSKKGSMEKSVADSSFRIFHLILCVVESLNILRRMM